MRNWGECILTFLRVIVCGIVGIGLLFCFGFQGTIQILIVAYIVFFIWAICKVNLVNQKKENLREEDNKNSLND